MPYRKQEPDRFNDNTVFMKKTLVFIALATCCLVGCRKVTDPKNPEKTLIPINITMSGWTKVNDSSYETGDQVGIYVVNYNGNMPGTLAQTGNHVDNMRFTKSTAQWTPDEEIYWKDKDTKADFYCYYPYSGSVSVKDYLFSVQSDQSDYANYQASEFLWGKTTGIAPTETAVPILTNRCMSNALIYVTPGSGFTQESLDAANIRVEICNTKIAANIDLATGTAKATGAVQTITAYKAGDYYRAMVVPQTVADGTELINIYVDGVKYSLTKGVTFTANTRHKFTVSVNKTSGGINIGIGGWDESEEDNGGSAE